MEDWLNGSLPLLYFAFVFVFLSVDPRVQLNAAQSRCSLLEKQLDYMRKMVSSVELEQKMVLEQQVKPFSILTE